MTGAAIAQRLRTGARGTAAWLLLAALALAVPAAGQCPDVPADAFAFIPFTDEECSSDPGVRWPAAGVIYDCDFLTDDDKLIDCSGSPETCAEICRAATDIWNADLPGRFTFAPANEANPVEFCDTEDGRVSVGGTTTLCDGTTYGNNTLAVTLSIFFNTGSQAGQLIDANITVNKKFRFTQASFQATLAHEFGHALGLGHPDECGDDFNVLMRSSSMFRSTQSCFVVDPTVADVTGAERIYAVTKPLCGDADANGSVTVTDGVQTLRAAADLPSPCTLARCDMDGNGTLSVSDGVHVLRGAAGLTFTADCP